MLLLSCGEVVLTSILPRKVIEGTKSLPSRLRHVGRLICNIAHSSCNCWDKQKKIIVARKNIVRAYVWRWQSYVSWFCYSKHFFGIIGQVLPSLYLRLVLVLRSPTTFMALFTLWFPWSVVMIILLLCRPDV